MTLAQELADPMGIVAIAIMVGIFAIVALIIWGVCDGAEGPAPRPRRRRR
jgi:hypothetical protein